MKSSLSIFQTLELHRRIIDQSGGSLGLRDIGALESALTQPEMTYAGIDLYPTIIEKIGALAYSLCMNHPFVDGNKRVAHATMEILLIMNGFEITATIDEQENLFLHLANGEVARNELTSWISQNIKPISISNH